MYVFKEKKRSISLYGPINLIQNELSRFSALIHLFSCLKFKAESEFCNFHLKKDSAVNKEMDIKAEDTMLKDSHYLARKANQTRK